MAPNTVLHDEAPVEGRTYQVPVDARYTAASVLPSPSKSAGTSWSPLSPQPNQVHVEKLACDSRMNQVPDAGRNTAGSVTPGQLYYGVWQFLAVDTADNLKTKFGVGDLEAVFMMSTGKEWEELEDDENQK